MEDKYQKYRNRAFSGEQWFLLKKAIDSGIEVKDIANERFSPEQMTILLEARRNDIDLSAIADPELSEEQMRRLIRKISEEMGLYEAHYEKTRRKWLKNITWATILSVFLFGSSAILFGTKDHWMKYFQELYVKLSEDTITLEVGEHFDPANYVTAFDPQAELLFPDIETDQIGSTWAVYTITNGKKSKEVRLLVHIVDTTAPDIVLSAAEITLEQGEDIKPSSYLVSAKDTADGDVADKVEMHVLDNIIQYIVCDSSGNETRKEITIHYRQPPSPLAETPAPQQKKTEEPHTPIETAPPAPPKQTSPAPFDRLFPFQEGSSANDTYQECMNSAAASQGVFRATCQIYNDENGTHKGYRLHFE